LLNNFWKKNKCRSLIRYPYDLRVDELFLEILKLERIIESNQKKIKPLEEEVNTIRLEIIKYTFILQLMEKGFTFYDAKKKVEQTMKEPNPIKKNKVKNKDIKRIYKKLVFKYHPDKYGDNEIIVKINEAYKNGDHDYLLFLYTQEGSDSKDSYERLTKKYEEIINSKILNSVDELKDSLVKDLENVKSELTDIRIKCVNYKPNKWATYSSWFY
jgi:hypothetical protein